MYFIDQSIKIENTNKTSYVALANGSTIIASISAKDKVQLKLWFRQLQKPLVFKLFTFCYLIVKSIQTLSITHVTIDTEYPGHEIDIKNYISQLLRNINKEVPMIRFAQIGKANSAHLAVYEAYKKRSKGIRVTYKEVITGFGQIEK